MALSAAAGYTTHSPDEFGRFTVAAGVTIQKGALVSLVVGTGTVTNFNDAEGHQLVGMALEKVVGDGTLKIQVRLAGLIIRDRTITGVTGAIHNGRSVYAEDENTFTLAAPSTDAQPVGIVLDADGTNADVLLFGVQSAVALQLAGGNRRTLGLGTLNTSMLEAVIAANMKTGIKLQGHGVITRFWARPAGFDAGYVAGSQLLNLEIGGTNVTGGVLTLAFGDIDTEAGSDAEVAATAITGANEFHDGDLLDVERAAAGTGFTAVADTQAYDLFIDVEYRAGV